MRKDHVRCVRVQISVIFAVILLIFKFQKEVHKLIFPGKEVAYSEIFI